MPEKNIGVVMFTIGTKCCLLLSSQSLFFNELERIVAMLRLFEFFYPQSTYSSAHFCPDFGITFSNSVSINSINIPTLLWSSAVMASNRAGVQAKIVLVTVSYRGQISANNLKPLKYVGEVMYLSQ